MSLSPIFALVQRHAGLDPSALGSAAATAVVRQRLDELGLDAARYAARLASDPNELQHLIDALVVPETWFYRGASLFPYLADHVRSVALTRAEPVRVLSVPCSTGEEPYSLALALTEARVPPARWSILGVDISGRNIERARRGVFGGLAFRQLPADLRERYFRPLEGGTSWEVAPALRSSVQFQKGNLLEPGLLSREQPYDLAFCRNLFIYLDADARRRALNRLAALVVPGGLLCLGHAEALEQADRRFARTGPDGYFLYRRAAGATTPAAPPPTMPPSRQPPAPWEEEEAIAPPAGGTPRTSAPLEGGNGISASPERLDGRLLARAREQADLGQYSAALDLCRQAQEQLGPSADLYALMGVVHQARHERGAALASFHKALYLDARHREALTHLMLLYQTQGDGERAAVLRRRLEGLPSGDVGEER